MNKLLGLGVILIILWMMIISPAQAATYAALVQQARQGNTQPVLQWFDEHRGELSLNQLADWLQIAVWADKNNTAIQVWQRHSRARVPARGVAAAAQAYRNTQQWQESLGLWQQARRLAPNDSNYKAGWIMTLADAGQTDQALRRAKQWEKQQFTSLSNQALAYVYQQRGNDWAAFYALSNVRRLAPNNAYNNQQLLDTMVRLRVAEPALQLGEEMQASDAELRQLQLGALAEKVRFAPLATRQESHEFAVAKDALAGYAAFLEQWQDDPRAEADITQARIDRLGAYWGSKDYDALIAEYESLEAAGKPIPAYTLRWVALAYNNRQQPRKAQPLIQQFYAETDTSQAQDLPEPEQAQELYYTAMDNNDWDLSQSLIQLMIKDSPYQRYEYGNPVPQPNERWLTGRVLQAQYWAATNQLPKAEQASRELAHAAAGNQELAIQYADVLSARGWPRRAEYQLKLAEAIEPSNLELERQQAYVAQELQEWEQFDLLTKDVVARSPKEQSSQRLAKINRISHDFELRASASKGLASNSPVTGSHDLTLDLALYFPRLAHHWRPFIGGHYATGRFDEGTGYNREVLGGVEWTSRDNWAELAVLNQNMQAGNKLGLRLAAWHDFNDHWRLSGQAERLSADTPLRALHHGITANRFLAELRWYHSERREVSVWGSISPFSDDNRRTAIGIEGKQRLWSAPRWTLDATPYITASKNTAHDVPYFNPLKDLAIVPALTAEHLIYQRNTTSWSQQFMAGLGAYWQQDYGTGAITELAYGQSWSWDDRFELSGLLSWGKQPYDGDRDRSLSLSIELDYWF